MDELSAKMPSQQDASRAARMPATMKSERPGSFQDEGGSDDGDVGECSQTTSPGVGYQAVDRDQEPWQSVDAKKDNPSNGWSNADRSNTGEGGRAQANDDDDDTDGDLY